MSFPEPGRADSWDFVEFWLDPSASPPYALLLLGKEDGLSWIIDPAQSYQKIFSADSYDDVRNWLLEDEYERVEGRLQYSEV